MQSQELYEEIRGLERPWRVVDVELGADGREVRGEDRERAASATVPGLWGGLPAHDTRSRHWRHLDTGQFVTIPQAAVPRNTCGRLGVKLSAADPL